MSDAVTAVFPLDPLHCDQCGAALVVSDDRGKRRPWCDTCERLVFRNPTVGVAVLVRDSDGRVLMVKRASWATQPGKWSLPAGYMDYGEDVREAGAREVLEETGVRVVLGELLHVATTRHDPAKMGVCLWFEAATHEGTPVAADDAVDVGWFALDELPELAFETDEAVFAQLG